MSSGPKSVGVLLEGVVLEDSYPGPMMESIVKGQRRSCPHEDFGFLLTALTALLCDGSNATEASEGLEISEANRVVGIAEYRREHAGAHARKRGNDGGVGVGARRRYRGFLVGSKAALAGTAVRLRGARAWECGDPF